MTKDIVRDLENVLYNRADYKKAILLLGPRQVGKTTLAKLLGNKLSSDYIYFNGDEIQTRSLWQLQQVPLLKQTIEKHPVVILDEAQMIEDVGIICKQLIDADLHKQFIITGSSMLDIAHSTQEPLTGRKWEYYLYPISYAELYRHQGFLETNRNLESYLVYGTYPEVASHLPNAVELLNNLTSSYLYKDVLALTGLRKPQLLDRILQALSLQIGSEVSLNELAGLVGADVKTVDQYIYLLEQVFVVYRLNAFSRNLRNEINRKKKIYFYDNGIRNAVIGDYKFPGLRNDLGALWENFLITERKKLLAYHGFYGHTYFWRDKRSEIDYIEEIDGTLYAYEFKWSPGAKVKFPNSFTATYQPRETKVIHRDNYQEWLNAYPY
ncbi:ATPase [Niabella ginsenosidivorans]|uniref:ATPase n=1 Tax=Niabella ginsenosidivorans TaxID=1176587 RepID=A0A1A9I6S6_9BACT|nr:ATP-binding protein [Niabella ginsenosidivorans]ANH83378.1 ATPase [Niabella ginsenosidivorans]